MDNVFADIFMSLWLFSCFICIGFSFHALAEGFGTFLFSLLLVPFGPIVVAYQWALFHSVTNKNLYLLADVINNNFEKLNTNNENK